MKSRNNDPKIIRAKFDGICEETGNKIKKGDFIAYYPLSKAVFCQSSKSFQECQEYLADLSQGFNY